MAPNPTSIEFNRFVVVYVWDTKTTGNECLTTKSNLSAERLPLSVEEEGGQNEDDQADSDDRSQLQLLLLLSIHLVSQDFCLVPESVLWPPTVW